MKFMEIFGGKKEGPVVLDENNTDARIRALQAKLAEFQNNPNHPDIGLRQTLGLELENLMETKAKGL